MLICLDVSVDAIKAAPEALHALLQPGQHCIFICRRGNSSQEASFLMKEWAKKNKPEEDEARYIDIIGGLTAWASDIDPSFPIY